MNAWFGRSGLVVALGMVCLALLDVHDALKGGNWLEAWTSVLLLPVTVWMYESVRIHLVRERDPSSLAQVNPWLADLAFLCIAARLATFSVEFAMEGHQVMAAGAAALAVLTAAFTRALGGAQGREVRPDPDSTSTS